MTLKALLYIINIFIRYQFYVINIMFIFIKMNIFKKKNY